MLYNIQVYAVYIYSIINAVLMVHFPQNLRDALDCMYDAKVPKVWQKVRTLTRAMSVHTAEYRIS